MNTSGIVNYEIHRAEKSIIEESIDSIAIEEPLEIAIRYFKDSEWIIEPLMVTMRTPGDDQALVSGLLFSEGIIQDKSAIDKIDSASMSFDYSNSSKFIALYDIKFEIL